MKWLHAMIAEKGIFEMIYLAADQRVTQRFIRVIEVHEKDILAYCYYRKQLRLFKLENILSIQKVNRRAGA
ncbi:hypothetical protein [Oceanobacillus sp. CFH 90083]|uniref:hypothetical protein n=1 Tax=Oceanobacillus sp. CFH 90083 TaxID=2592336 RepID=UPI00128B9852|nr:hypothetical protein [Oceanobacillus sp. CFH 90083]